MTVMSTGSQRQEVGGPAAIDLRGVHKHFGRVRAVRGIDLSIASGEIVALLGPNGAGKTTTIDMILGLSQPTDGQVAVYGLHPRQAIERGLISAVMQTGGLLKDLTVAETARYTASLFAASRPVEEVLRRAGISDLADRKVGKCSGGEQQRLRFAMALLPNPELLVLDEPTTGMDVEGRRGFWTAIRQDAELGQAYAHESAGHGNVSAFIMVSMALYGAVLATTSGGAMVSIERAAGWSRQLRLTPLSPAAYIVIKMLTAMVLGAAAVIAVYVVAKITGVPAMKPGYAYLWFVTPLCVWIGSLVFAAFGLFMGYLLPTENVMQFLGFVLMLFAFGGGLFIPLSTYPHALQVLAQYTPLYGLNQLVHAPFGGSVDLVWVVNAVAWLVIFTAGAVWRFRKDTARV